MPTRRRKSKHKIKVRSSIRTAVFIFFSLVICISLALLVRNIFITNIEKKEEVFYKSTEKFEQNYQVIMKENQYMDVKDIKPEQPYVTDLIDKLKVNFEYTYRGRTPEKINITYSIKGILKSTYSSAGKEEEFWNKEYVLLEQKEKNSKYNSVRVNENININLQEYNDLVNSFVDEMKIAVSSKLCVIFEANVTAYVNGETILDNYTNEMQITVGDKVTKITGDFDDIKENQKTKVEEVVKDPNSTENYIYLGIIAISVYNMVIFGVNTKSPNKITNMYKMELNQILSSCSDKIIKVDTNNNVVEDKVIEVKDINELIKLSEEAYKPILYYQIPEENESWFYVILENEIYRYILD